MSHLTRDERLLALDGALDAGRTSHLATCAACRGEVEALDDVLARVRAVDVPEPSPLFWDHLAARVGDAIAREPAPVRTQPWWTPRLAWAAIAIVVTATGGYLASRMSAPPPIAPAVAATTVVPGGGVEAATVALDDDGGWDLITAMADDAGAEALGAQVGQSELSISALSDEERTALAGELRAMLPPGVREG